MCYHCSRVVDLIITFGCYKRYWKKNVSVFYLDSVLAIIYLNN